jgi:hypothetical protein
VQMLLAQMQKMLGSLLAASAGLGGMQQQR